MRRTVKRKGRLGLMVLATAAAGVPLGVPATSRAETADKFWKNSVASGNWSVSSNWSAASANGTDNGGPPGSNDFGYIQNTDFQNHTITLDTSVSISQLRMGALNGETDTLLQTGNFNITADLEALSSDNNTHSVHTQSAGTNTFGISLIVGSDSGDVSTYNLSGSGVVNLTGSGSSPGFYVGDQGTGIFNQSGGAVTTSSNVPTYIGNSVGGAGAYSLGGSGSLTANGIEYIGGSGTGSFNQTGGTHAANNVLVIGNAAGSSGSYTLSNTGILTVPSPEFIGDSGQGSFVQSGGSHTVGSTVTSNNLVIGNQANSVGSYSLSGSGNLTVHGDETIGNFGQGSFNQTGGTHTITGGTSGTSGSLKIAAFGGSSGAYTLGGGSLTTNAAYVGGTSTNSGGNGTLTVSGGTMTVLGGVHVWNTGVLNLNSGTLSVGSSASDVIVNDGVFNNSGGTLNLTGEMTGSGTFTQSGSGSAQLADQTPIDSGTVAFNGGTVTAVGTLLVGKADGSDGAVTVAGADVSVAGNLCVGNDGALTGGSGSGTVNVSDGSLAVAHLVLLGSTVGGGANLYVSSVGNVKAAGLSFNDVNVSGGELNITSQAPSGGDDPEINGALVGGYLRDGAMHVHGGTITAPVMKLGITSGKTGSYDQDNGSVTLTTMGVGNDADLNSGSGTGSVTLSGGTLTTSSLLVGSSAGGNGEVTWSGGKFSPGSVSITSGGKVTVSPRATGGFKILRTSELNLSGNGVLDLNDNDLVVNNGVFSDIQALVFAGYRQGADPSATGIVSTTGQTAAGNPILAVLDNALVHSADYPFGSGQTISANAVVGKYTYFGDTNLDGQVTADDYGALDANFGATGVNPGVAWIVGDTNFDGRVTADDYGTLDANFGLGVGNPLSAQGAAAVPEPGGLGVVVLGMGLVRRRKRISRG